MKTYARLVNNGVEAVDVAKDLQRQGFSQDQIYVLAHERDRTNLIAGAADANRIGIAEEGMIDSIANLFRSRGDELRSKIRSLGFSSYEAGRYESELDNGKVLVMAKL